MKRFYIIFLFFVVCFNTLYSQKNILQSGPMPGYTDMFETVIWVQTTRQANVKIIYWNKNEPARKNSSKIYTTSPNDVFIAKIVIDSLKPGQIYGYDLYLNNVKIVFPYQTAFKTLPIWRWRTEPPDFQFACGSGTYINETEYDRPGKPYGGEYQIFKNIALQKPDFMLWLGDNVYLREPDWNTWTGITRRYTHTRSLPEMQELLANTHNYAIVDDHDFGPDNSDGSFWNKNLTLKAFRLFWANPSYGIGDMNNCTTFFNWNDVDFFLLDNRTNRTADERKGCNKTQLGTEQLEWLKNALVYSKASFKIIVMGGQFLNPVKEHETYSNYGFDTERKEIIDFIYSQNIKNTFFLTGDRHHTELSVLKTDSFPVIYDLTVSALTSGSNTKSEFEANTLRVENTYTNKRNFALIQFSGTFINRKMTIIVKDSNGLEIWRKEIIRE